MLACFLYHHINLAFYSMPVLAFGYCRCLCLRVSVRPRVNHLLVRAITQDSLKLGSPNVDQRCKTLLLRSLLFLGGNIHWPSRLNLTWMSRFTPFGVAPHHNSDPFKLGSPYSDQGCKVIPVVLGVVWPWPVGSYLTLIVRISGFTSTENT